ncbi:MAG: hypothetical protein HYV09_14985 [Deltaproteobacteria bacterium]|nr:hypothetical protein [Deltaproteobacteria bacterium]
MRPVLLAVLLLGCSESSPSGTTPAATDAGAKDTGIAPEDYVFGGDRPVPFFRAPEGADPKTPMPLVVVLHGFGASGLMQAIYLKLDKLVNEKKFLLVAPDGTPDKDAKRFWNAVDTCCDFDGTKVDDVKYLTGLVDEIASVWAVDRKRVYLAGHSNGGAMSYRLACDAAPTFAAAWVLAPPFYADMTKCKPSAAVSIRHVHGTADETVDYAGGPSKTGGLATAFPSARATVEAWAKWNGCAATADESAAPIDFDLGVPGAETKIAKWPSCRDGVATELWSLEGSTHIPMKLSPDLGQSIWSFFEQHPRK